MGALPVRGLNRKTVFNFLQEMSKEDLIFLWNSR
jgi:hypothetical protein